jgi:tetratricopeptide (TPR) repeat protein
MNQVRTLAAAAVVLLLFTPVYGDDSAYHQAIVVGDQSRGEGKWKEADEAYRRAKKLARENKDSANLAKASIRRAVALPRWADADSTLADELNKEAIGELVSVIDNRKAPLDLKELARNNLGVLYLHLGENDAAVKVLAALPDPVNEDRHVYFYNYGRALETVKKPNKALALYMRSLEARPTYEPAARRASALLLHTKQPTHKDIDEAVGLLRFLLAPTSSQLELVGTTTTDLMAQWEKNAVPLIPVLFEYYTVSGIGPGSIANVERERLNKVRKVTSFFDPYFAAVTRALDVEHLDERAAAKPAFTSRNEVVSFFDAAWLNEEGPSARAFSHLLKRLGDAHYQTCLRAKEKSLESVRAAARAMLLDTAAFFLDVGNTEALVSATSVLDQYRRDFDKDNALSKELTKNLFTVKSELYLKARKRRDWSNIYSCHVILGNLYRNQDPPIWGRLDDLQSAIGQWNRAREVEHLIRTGRSAFQSLPPGERDSQFPESPVLRQHLADAYREIKDERAPEAYIDAVDSFASAGEPGRARRLAAQTPVLLRESGLALTNEQKRRLNDLSRVATNIEKVMVAAPFRETAPDRLTSVAFDQTGKRLAVGAPGQIGFLDLETHKLEPLASSLVEHQSGPVLWQPGSKRFAVMDMNKGHLLVGTPENQVILRAHLKDPTSATFSDERRIMCLSHGGRAIHIWHDNTPLPTLEAPGEPIEHLAAAPGGKLIAGAVGTDVVLWSQLTGGKPRTLKGHLNRVTALAFGDNATTLASGDAGGGIRLWLATTGEPRQSSLPHQEVGITLLRFAPKGDVLCVGSAGGTVRLYHAQSGEELVRLPYSGRLTSLAFALDGQALAVGTAPVSVNGVKLDGEIRVWRLGSILAPR